MADEKQSEQDQRGDRAVGDDDERQNREEIEKTGEPQRDKLGNADGAS